MLTEKFSAAMSLAAKAHASQKRKGTSIPYITHPIGVASLVLEFGGDEDQSIAALLHDVIEDCGAEYREPICRQFGDRVLAIVECCTDGVPDATGRKEKWRPRKERYLAHLKSVGDDALLVSGCDKLHNARSILNDLRDPSVGRSVFTRFSVGTEETLWYYGELARVFDARQCPVAFRLNQTIGDIVRHSTELR